MKTDFIVIGSGLSGLTSSLILSKYGKVLLVTKGKLSDGATNWAQGGIACAVAKNDSWQRHFEDTLIAGAFHNDKKAVEFLVKNAPIAINWLSKQGVPFKKSYGKYKTGREGGHSYNRIIHATDFTGKEIENTLTVKVKKNKNIKIWEYAFVQKLLVNKKRCSGVQVIKDKQLINCSSKITVLASGGLGQVYQWTTNPSVSSGDGYAIAKIAGAKLADMEFIQFHPTALKDGKSPLFLLSEVLRGEGAHLTKLKVKSLPAQAGEKFKVTGEGERFMEKVDSRAELAPRDIVARAIFYEQQKGFEIYLDIRYRGGKFLQKRFPNIYRELKNKGFDLTADLIPVTPAAHYCCGGVKTDLHGRTNIKNLFAFGEVASTGVHGANRLASNSLLEAVVFPLQLLKMHGSCHSRIQNSASKSLHFVGLKASETTFGRPSLPSPAVNYVVLRHIRGNLQKLMWEKVGIIRTISGLLEAKEKIAEWEKESGSSVSLDREFLELKNMLLVSKLIIVSALRRPRSLGAHFVAVDKN